MNNVQAASELISESLSAEKEPLLKELAAAQALCAEYKVCASAHPEPPIVALEASDDYEVCTGDLVTRARKG